MLSINTFAPVRSQASTSSSFLPTAGAVTALLGVATPVLRINGLTSERWRGLKAEGDPRNGPWFYSDHEVLDPENYRRRGECLYFLIDRNDHIRYVGESKNNLRDRWRTPPGIDLRSGKRFEGRTVFHNRAWKHLEHAISAEPGVAPFFVRALPRPQLGAVVDGIPQLRDWVSALRITKPEKHLAQSVQDWVCAQPDVQTHLWNVSGTIKRRTTKKGK